MANNLPKAGASDMLPLSQQMQATTTTKDTELDPRSADSNQNSGKGTSLHSGEELQSSFVERISQYQEQLERDFQEFESALSNRGRDHEPRAIDWSELESRYEREMGVQITAEQEIIQQFSERFKQFMLWMQVSNEKDAERALKRLRTRVTYVQNSEDQLKMRQEHFARVLAAFQDAMALFASF